MPANNALPVQSWWRQRNNVKEYSLYLKLLNKKISFLSSMSVSEKRTLSLLLMSCNRSTNEHGQRVVLLARAVAHELHLSDDEIFLTCLVALLHDIGKAGIPEEILNKPGSLDEDEWKVMRSHVEIGQRMLLRAGGIFACLAPSVLSHHERWDGGGYPHGCSGAEIPLMARIITVVDAYDAIVQRRVYHEPQSVEEACAELQRCAGSQFDPHIVAIFLSLLDEPARWQESSMHNPAVGEVELVDAMYAMPSLQSDECVPASA